MWIAFDNVTESVIRKLDYGSPARQGITNSFNIFAYFDGLDINESYIATIAFERPDGTKEEVTFIMDYVPENVFDISRISPSSQDTYPFVNGESYAGFSFTPQDPAILGMAGTYSATINIYDGNLKIVSGTFKFYVEPTANDEEWNIDRSNYDEIMQKLAQITDGEINSISINNVPLEVVDHNVDLPVVTKVDDTNIVYGTNLSGEEFHIAYTFNVTGLSLVQRDSNGQVLVPETPTANNNAASKKYVDDAKQEIKDIAESRIKNWILSYDETITTVKNIIVTRNKFLVLNSSGEFEDKKAELLNGDYDNLNIANNIFNSNYQTAGFQDNTYLIFKNIGHAVGVPSNDYEFYMVSRANFKLVAGPIGSNIYVTNTDVPDRWISYIQSYGSPTIFSALESKTKLSDYPTKTEMNTAISEAQLGGTASFDQLPTENSQNAVTSGGVYQALHNILFMHNEVSVVILTTLPAGNITIALANPIISNKSIAPQTLSSLGQLISNYLVDSNKCEVSVTGTVEVGAIITGAIKKFGYYPSTDTPYIVLDGSSTEISLADHRSTQATSSTDYIATIL